MTGESVPRDVGVGDTVISGCINLQGVLEIQTTTDFSQSTVAKVLELTENAQSKKARVESFITRFAKVYTPIVVISALLLAVVPSFVVGNPGDWIHRALTFLVVSCPCALVLSVPLSYFNGIGGASGKGVLVKGGAALDMLAKCDTLVFDKTGTLTKGNLAVSRVIPKGISEEKLLEYASYAEAYSSHPIAKGIINAYNKEIDLTRVSCLEIAGKGIKAEYEGKEILCGNKDLLLENGIAAEYETEITAVFLAVDGKYVGVIELEDELKEGIAEFISDARRLGIKKTVMLTGDKRAIGEKIGRAIGIDEVRAELLPDEKVNELEKLMADGCRAAYTGDGINDAPVLARVDIGIAMGGMGTDAAIEAADVVIMNDDVTKILTAIKISKRTQRIVVQNIVFSLAVKFSVLGLSAFGLTTMWWAVFADAGVSLIAIVNSLRSRMNKV
jgi:Cd2+/Zn2+-exporting ATPase